MRTLRINLALMVIQAKKYFTFNEFSSKSSFWFLDRNCDILYKLSVASFKSPPKINELSIVSLVTSSRSLINFRTLFEKPSSFTWNKDKLQITQMFFSIQQVISTLLGYQKKQSGGVYFWLYSVTYWMPIQQKLPPPELLFRWF